MRAMTDGDRVYLDWAAATPLLPEAKAAMLPYLESDFGNPSAIHQEGVIARQAVETAREQVARAVSVRPEFVTFTAGGTEGNNLAILGTIEQLRRQGREYSSMQILTTKIEHPSVGRTFSHLESLGVEVITVPVLETGKIDLSTLKSLISEKTVLLSTALINSEIGTIQSTRAIKKVLSEADARFETRIVFHVDAAQAPLWVSCQFDTVAADVLVLDAAKCCGPKGVGVFVRSPRVAIAPTIFGGGQEAGLRAGTENVAGIVGAAVAIESAQGSWRERAELVRAVRDQAISMIATELPEAILNGASREDRVANNINISIPGLDTEFATVVLDRKGFAVSTKSACSGAGGGESVVVKETTGDPARATSTLRITLGPDTTVQQLQALIAALKTHIEKMSNL